MDTERIRRTDRRPARAARYFWRAMAVTGIGILLVALGFLATAFFTGGLP